MVNRVVSNATRGAGKPRSFPLSPNPSPPIRCRSPLGIKFPIRIRELPRLAELVVGGHRRTDPVELDREVVGARRDGEDSDRAEHLGRRFGLPLVLGELVTDV